MGKKLLTAAAGATICLAICAFSSFKKAQTTDKILEVQARAHMKDGDNRGAVEHLLKIKTKTAEIYRLLAECHEKMGQLMDALVYITMAIKNEKRVRESTDKRFRGCVEKRIGICKYLGMKERVFKDLFLMTMITDETECKREATENLQEIALQLSRENPVIGPASKVSYREFFDTLMFIQEKEVPTTVFIKSGEYQKCYDMVRECDGEYEIFLSSCFRLVHGDYKGAYNNLENQDYLHSQMLRLYLGVWMESKGLSVGEKRSALRFGDLDENSRKNLSSEEIDRVFGEISDESGRKLAFLLKNDDQTVFFYLSKVFEILRARKSQEEMLRRAISAGCNAVLLKYRLITLIRDERPKEAVRLISEGIEKYPGDVGLYSISIEYFLHMKSVKQARNLLDQLEPVALGDPRLYVLRYLVSKADGHPNAEHLKAGIKVDSLYYKTYIYLGNHMMGTSDSLYSYKMALSCARTVEEAYAAYQLIIVLETQVELSREYPSLFS